MSIFILLTSMYKYVLLLADRYAPSDHKHWIKCETLERAKSLQKVYTQDNKYYADIYPLGEMVS